MKTTKKKDLNENAVDARIIKRYIEVVKNLKMKKEEEIIRQKYIIAFENAVSVLSTQKLTKDHQSQISEGLLVLFKEVDKAKKAQKERAGVNNENC